MNVKKDLKKLWNYIIEEFEEDEVLSEFEDALKRFRRNDSTIDDKMIDALSEDDARALFVGVGYIAVNVLFGGDFETWYYVLEDNLEFDSETIQFLDF